MGVIGSHPILSTRAEASDKITGNFLDETPGETSDITIGGLRRSNLNYDTESVNNAVRWLTNGVVGAELKNDGDFRIINDLLIDVINEKTPAAGVTIDGVLLKDSNITGTLKTAAQPDITSLGTLTALTINSATVTLSQDTNFAIPGEVNGFSIDGDTFSVDGTNKRVGIGASSPAAKLQVKINTDDTVVANLIAESMQIQNAGVASNGALTGIGFHYGTASQMPVFIGSKFTNQGVNSASSFVILTAPDGAVGNLVERFSVASDGGIFFNNLLATAASTDVNINGSNELHSVTSSRRYKENEIKSTLDLSNYSDIQVVEYDFKQEFGGIHEHGIIAEDLDLLYPQFVYKKAFVETTEVLDENGHVISEAIYGEKFPDSVQYSRISILNILKIQELELRIKLLEAA